MSRVRKGYCSKNPRLRKVFIIYKKLDCRYPVIKETSTKKQLNGGNPVRSAFTPSTSGKNPIPVLKTLQVSVVFPPSST